MREATLIQEISVGELRELFRGIVQQENEELRREVVLLREELRHSRRVITHKEAAFYFDSEVTPETVLTYVHYQGLPAAKTGRIWFIYLQDLFDWQIGLIGHTSTKKDGIKSVISPRHRQYVSARSDPKHDRSAQHRGEGSDPTDARGLDAHKISHY